MGIVKNVSFKQKETELLKYIEDKDFSYYVKSLIKELYLIKSIIQLITFKQLELNVVLSSMIGLFNFI